MKSTVSPASRRPHRPLRARCGLTLLCIIAVAACSTTNDDGDPSGGGGTGGGGGGGGGGDCSAGGSFGLECQATIEIVDAATGLLAQNLYQFSAGDVKVGEDTDLAFKVRNTGNTGLVFTKIEFLYSEQSPAEAGAPALSCQGPDGGPCAQSSFPVVQPTGNPNAETSFKVTFKRYDDDLKRDAAVRLHTNDKNKPVVTITFTTASGTPKIKLQPDELDFKTVAIDNQGVANVALFNVGNAVLEIGAMDLTSLDAAFFAIVVDGKEHAAGALVTLEPALKVVPGSSLQIQGLYTALDDKPKSGTIVLHTNDPTVQSAGVAGHQAINVRANTTGPCLLIVPGNVAFGATEIGSVAQRDLGLKSCGDEPVVIDRIIFAAPGGGEFSVAWSETPEVNGVPPSKDAPLTIGLNETVILKVEYSPDGPNPTNADGLPIPDKSTLVVYSNVAAKETKVTMEGVGSSSDCPTAIMTITEGDTVVPQTELHLDGSQSQAGAGAISKYAWEVKQPVGSVSLFSPNASSPKVTFQPNVAGDYVFRLTVYDANGTPSCFPAERFVKVLPDQAIHVELLWTTPGDPDQTDEGPGAGADLDLHFAHPYASGLDFDGDGAADPWFDNTYDCFWFNKNPEWASYDPNVDDNPSLDRDDTDGAGPENLNLTLPEDGKTYAVGVHYFDDHGKGPSVAEVRIYIYGQLQFQVTSKQLSQSDMWYVAEIEWPTGDIAAKTDKGGEPWFITPKYPAPEL